MTRLFTWLLTVPLGIVLIALAVANRRAVTISLDPFAPETPALAVAIPLFVIILASVILGVVLGGFSVWVAQGRHRREERRWRETARRLEAEKSGERPAGPARLIAPRRAA